MTLERSAHDLLAPILLDLAAHVRANAHRVAHALDDEEAIHDYRVALRKLRTILRTARAVYGRRRMKRLGRALAHFADAASALRDEEVLRDTIGALPLGEDERAIAATWLAKRARREREDRRELGRVVLEPALEELLAQLEGALARGAKQHASATDLAAEAIAAARADVAHHEIAAIEDALAMHELRIRHKRLRYAAELLASALGPEADELARMSAKMQKRLGELHDLDEASVRVRRATSLSLASRRSLLGALDRARAACAEKVRASLPAREATLDPAP